jgi:hypothetical protein
MNAATEDDLQDDPRVMQIAREYLDELEAGRARTASTTSAAAPNWPPSWKSASAASRWLTAPVGLGSRPRRRSPSRRWARWATS